MTTATPAAPPAAEGPTVLLVDDEPDILEAVQTTLEAYIPECTVLTAGSGRAGLDILKATTVHVILTDYRMPEMDGLEFLARSRSLAPRAMRIMVTAFPDLELAIRALNEQRVLNFITKPVEAERLVAVVKEAISVREDQLAQARAMAAALHAARRHAAHSFTA